MFSIQVVFLQILSLSFVMESSTIYSLGIYEEGCERPQIQAPVTMSQLAGAKWYLYEITNYGNRTYDQRCTTAVYMFSDNRRSLIVNWLTFKNTTGEFVSDVYEVRQLCPGIFAYIHLMRREFTTNYFIIKFGDNEFIGKTCYRLNNIPDGQSYTYFSRSKNVDQQTIQAAYKSIHLNIDQTYKINQTNCPF